jgi:hypothetical protein
VSFLRRAPRSYASVEARKPFARSEDLVIEEFDDELLIYDRRNTRAHCLGATAVRVWQACDGKTDIDGLADALDLSRDTVLHALSELEACELLDLPELQVIGGNGNGNGVTRRDFAWKSAKVGAAAASVPLVYSIAVPTALAASSPTNFQCALFSTSACGVSSGAGAVPGCCCCCQGGGNCKVGGSIASCSTEVCPAGGLGHCSASCNPPPCSIPLSSSGCCGVSGSTSCGCAFAGGPNANQGGCICSDTSGNCNGNSQTGCAPGCSPGTANCGSGCCSTASCTKVAAPGGGSYLINCGACTPGDPNCVPCCNGSPISQTNPSPFQCCAPGPTFSSNGSTCKQMVFT